MLGLHLSVTVLLVLSVVEQEEMSGSRIPRGLGGQSAKSCVYGVLTRFVFTDISQHQRKSSLFSIPHSQNLVIQPHIRFPPKLDILNPHYEISFPFLYFLLRVSRAYSTSLDGILKFGSLSPPQQTSRLLALRLRCLTGTAGQPIKIFL